VVQPFFLIKFLLNNYFFIYLKPTLACQTKANKKNKTGITGSMSVSGPKIAKAPGNLVNKNVSI